MPKPRRYEPLCFLAFIEKVRWFEGIVALAGELALDHELAAEVFLPLGFPFACERAIPPAIFRIKEALHGLPKNLPCDREAEFLKTAPAEAVKRNHFGTRRECRKFVFNPPCQPGHVFPSPFLPQ